MWQIAHRQQAGASSRRVEAQAQRTGPVHLRSISTHASSAAARQDYHGSASNQTSRTPVRGHDSLAPCSRGARVVCAVAAPDAPTTSAPKLVEVELRPVISNSGNIAPQVPEGALQAVYAIYDQAQRLQYIGIGSDLRNSLRQMLGRRPDKSWYYRATFLETSDQMEAKAVQTAWFEECGGAPKGNKLAMERNAWSQPVDGGAMSEKGKRGAAENCAKMLLETIRARGCVEDFDAIPGLLDQGLVEFMPVAGLSNAEMDAQAAAAAERAALCRQATAIVDGVEKKFLVHYDMKLPTRNGFMLDVTLIVDHKDTKHRVIASKAYYEPFDLPVEAAVEAALATILALKLPRETTGMLDSVTFPVNYFGVMQMDQWFAAEFAKQFERVTGGDLEDEEERAKRFWRFNRVHEYQAARLEGGDRHLL